MIARNLIAAVAALIGLSACAWTEDVVRLDYQPAPAAQVTGAPEAKVQVSVQDARTGNRAWVSVKKNGFGMEAAGIKSEREITEHVRSAIEGELRARGFVVDRGSAAVAIEMTRLWNDFKTGLVSGDAVADVTFNVKVADATGKVHYTKSVVAQGINSPIALASGENAKIAIDRALQTAIAQLVDDREFIGALLLSGRQVAGRPTS
jgi:uncharacterized lipoprotein YajG